MSITIGNTGQQTSIRDSKIIVPVDIQTRFQSEILMLNAINVASSATSNSAYQICEGFNKIKINIIVNSASTFELSVHWSTDGVNVQGQDFKVIDATGTTTTLSAIVDVGAKYFRYSVKNTDLALAHTYSAWAYLI